VHDALLHFIIQSLCFRFWIQNIPNFQDSEKLDPSNQENEI